MGRNMNEECWTDDEWEENQGLDMEDELEQLSPEEDLLDDDYEEFYDEKGEPLL